MANTREQFKQNPWSTNQSFLAREYGIKVLNTEEELYLYNMNTKEEISLKLIPNQLAESYSPKIISVQPFGVVRPINFYVGGDGKELSFSITLYEDYHNESGSLYQLIEKIKRLSLPYNDLTRSVLMPPIVYFQLGSQFAGLGHITTTINFSKPFRSGRYTVADMAVIFVFHEEFDDAPIQLSGDTFETNISSVSKDLSELVTGYDSVEDFIAQNLDYDYLISQVYSDSKISAFLNIVKIDSVGINQTTRDGGPFYGPDTTYSIQGGNYTLNAGISGTDLTNAWNVYKNPFGIRLVNYVYDFKNIIQPIFGWTNILNNLRSLQTNIDSLEQDFNNSYRPNFTTQGWYTVTICSQDPVTLAATCTTTWTRMTNSEINTFVRALSELKTLVRNQIQVYTITYGSGE